MFELAAKATLIETALQAITGLQSVGFVDKDDESMRRPVELPAAFVALDKIDAPTGKVARITTPITWVVLVRSKELGGASGCLALVDQVIDALQGLALGDAAKPLDLAGVVFFDKRDGTVAYAVRFTGSAVGTSSTTPCG